MEKQDWLRFRPSAIWEETVREFARAHETGTTATSDPVTVREQRAKLIEEIAYKLTDLVTIISGRIELLCETVPRMHLKDLHEIRTTAMKGVAFSELLLRAVQACRREMGLLEAERG